MISTKLDIGGNLLKLRQAKKYTQTDLAKAIGVKQSNYCEMERGKVIPTVPTLQKLAEFLEVPIKTLFEEEEEKSKIINNIQTLNGSIGENATNNFFESKEMEEKLKTTLSEAFASMFANEVAKLTKNKA